LSKYINFNIRVCRPYNLRKDHLQTVLNEVIEELGYTYDLQNVFDLARYFLPVSLVPRRFRRKALQFGSGLPTQVVSSSMLASAFGKVGFPIIPIVIRHSPHEVPHPSLFDRLFSHTNLSASPFYFRRSHPTLTTPGDFDLSPYLEVVKFNVIEPSRFDYSKIIWAEDENEVEEKPIASSSMTHS
jgi:hypothetical protein